MTELPRARPGSGAVAIASLLVLTGALLTSFRLAPVQDVATLLTAQSPRVLLGAGAGALLALAGALRQATGGERALRELEWLAASAGAASGGFAAASWLPAVPALAAFALGAAVGGGALLALARALDRPRRAANLGVLALLAALVFAAALAGTYARARRDAVAPAVAWLLGNLDGATLASSGALVAAAIALLCLGARALTAADRERARTLAWIATGLGIGAAGPLAFVGAMVPRAVGWLAPDASPARSLATSALAGAATVAAIDAVPRLLVGGYDFPFNVPAALLAIPIYCGWNRARLRGAVGAAPKWFEALEITAIVAATLAAAALAGQLTSIVRAAT